MPAVLPVARWTSAAALALPLVASLLAGCIEEDFVTLPPTANQVRNHSVRIDASLCLVKGGAPVPCPSDLKTFTAGQRVAHLRGVNGAPVVAVDLDQTEIYKQSFANVHAFWSRIPVGYGCGPTLQGVFPDASKPHADDKGVTLLANFQFGELTALIGAVRNANTIPLWTAAYHIGGGACTYADGEQKGQPIADAAKWAKVVRQVAKYYNRELPEKTLVEQKVACEATAGPRPWECNASLFNIEFGRDPFGAGGFTAATKAQWLAAYKAFTTELRQEFPAENNDVNLIAPSVVLDGELSVANSDAANPSRSPIFDFIDYAVANKLSPSFLSMEVEACSAVEARKIVQIVAKYASDKGLRCEKGLHHPSGADQKKDPQGKVVREHQCNGTEPIPIWVTGLRLCSEVKVPATLAADPARMSAYRGDFYAATKILWQGLVDQAVVGTAPRFPSVDEKQAANDEVAKTARPSDLMWYGHTAPPVAGSLLPAAWHAFWFNSGFLHDKQMVHADQGPDALGMSGTVASDPARNVVVLATRESCADNLGTPVDCIADASSKFPLVTKGRKRVVRALVADYAASDETGKEVLEHVLRIQVDKIPSDVKTVGYRWAFMDGTADTWTAFLFPEQGVLDVTKAGSFHLTRNVAVPSLHYVEFLF